MASVIDELVTVLGVDVNAGAFENIRRMSEGLEKLTKTTMKLGAELVATVGGFLYLGERLNESAAGVQKLSDLTGIGTKTIQEMGIALEGVGGNFHDAENSLKSFAERLSSPIPGEFNAQLMQLLGPDRYRALLHKPLEALMAVADELAKRNPLERLQWGKKLGFSDDMIRFLGQGRAKIQEEMAKAAASGKVLTEKQTKNALKFTESFKSIMRTISSTSEAIASTFAPELEKINARIDTWVKKNQELIGQDIRAFVIGITNAVDDLGRGIAAVIDWVGKLFPALADWRTNTETLSKVIEYLALTVIGMKLIGAFSGLLTIIGRVGAIFITGTFAVPAGAVIVSILAIAAAVALLATNWDKVKSAIESGEEAEAQYRKRIIYERLQKGQWIPPGMRDYIDIEGGAENVERILGPKRRKGGAASQPSRKGADQRAQAIMDILMKSGFSREAAAALTGTWFVETGGSLHPDQHQYDGGPGYGLAQWTDKSRQRGLVEFAKSLGKPVSDLQTQVLYAIEEIKKNPAYAKLLRGGTLEEMTRAAVYDYERPSNKALEYRRALPKAQQYYRGDINITQHIHGHDAFEIADRSGRKVNLALQRTYPGALAPVVG